MAPTHLYPCRAQTPTPMFPLFPRSETPTDQVTAATCRSAGHSRVSPPPALPNWTSHLPLMLSLPRGTQCSPLGVSSFSSLHSRTLHRPRAHVPSSCPGPPCLGILMSCPPVCQPTLPLCHSVSLIHSLTCTITCSIPTGSFPWF